VIREKTKNGQEKKKVDISK